METTSEGVVKAVEIVKSYCTSCLGRECDCPLLDAEGSCIVSLEFPAYWHLEEITRGQRHES